MPRKMTTTKIMKMTITLVTMWADTGLRLSRTGLTAWGWSRSRRILRTWPISSSTRMAFSPPEVEPAMPPQSDRMTNRKVMGTHHCEVSATSEPVVVSTLMVCTMPHRNASDQG